MPATITATASHRFARHLSRYRPVLRDRVAVQEAAWRERLATLSEKASGATNSARTTRT
ncbi:hypothetical protein ACLB9X_03565 [Streptomyces sp. 5K101]|uniref:hypothetical protein n=1 Tax=Streptomyces sp. 5K101 TaxID=3390037 RepID=UPI0039752213